MGFPVGWAWMHTMKVYRETFSTPVPKWLETIELYQRLSIARLAIRLRWRLPQEWLLDDDEGDPL
jgi:hypothetical protein